MTFHSVFALVVAILGAQETTACVTAHSYMQNCIFGGDGLSIQVFDNGHEVCTLYSNRYFASDEDRYYWDDQHGCSGGWSVSASHNGQSISFTAANGYSNQLTLTDTHNTRTYCGSAGDREIHGIDYESCFSDYNGDCAGQAGCSLCDFRAHC